ncbi:MAG: ABC transporter substrate-binding protein [Methanothrix sp.]|nr:ABC transporter substrate-binding protein [Methanothrix sp.]
MKTLKLPFTVMLMLMAFGAVASADVMDYALNVFGNANLDETIDENDIEYLSAVINGSENTTRLADANQDGEVNQEDIEQIKQITQGTEDKISVLDALNRTVTIKRPVERVISLRLAISEAMVAMGAEDKVVGVASDTAEQRILFPVLSQLPSVGRSSLSNADTEKIISLKPDLVLVNEYENIEQIKKLEAAGIVVVSSECHGNLLNLISATKRLGYIFGTVDKAEEYTNWYGSYLEKISSRVEGLSEDEMPTIFYYWNWGDENGPLGTSGQDCAVSPLISFVGGKDIASEMAGEYIEVDPEWVMEQNPSLVVRELIYKEMGYDVDNSTIATEKVKGFMNREGFGNIDAVKNGNVHAIAVNILSDNSWIGTVYLAKMIHPELFKDLDPIAVHQEYLTRFLNLDFDVRKQGVFVYPLPDDW